MNISYKYLFNFLLLILLGSIPKSRITGLKGHFTFNFSGTTILLSEAAVSLYILISSAQSSTVSKFSPTHFLLLLK